MTHRSDRVNLVERSKRLMAYRITLAEMNTDAKEEQLACSLLSLLGVKECDSVIYHIAVSKLKVGEPLTKEDCERLGIKADEAKIAELRGLAYHTPVDVTTEPVTLGYKLGAVKINE